MPANAAAWYMAKRKFYMNQSFDQQLLPFLLKKYPEKFKVVGTQVVFQEVFTMEVAKEKLKYVLPVPGGKREFCSEPCLTQYRRQVQKQVRNHV